MHSPSSSGHLFEKENVEFDDVSSRGVSGSGADDPFQPCRGSVKYSKVDGVPRRGTQTRKLEKEYNDRVRDNSFFGHDFEVMPIMNKLYDVLLLRDVILEGFSGIHLPSLVAVGDQSHGKTSVLEAIVKKEFLPKGDQIQTRCPIEVQLIHIGKEHDSVGYSEILEEDGKTWTMLKSMEQVRKAIQERTDRIKTTCPAGVTEKRIVVRIYSPNVPHLTLIDLPGFLNVNTEGQDEQIIQKIKEVVRKEICNPNCIILAVTAAGNNIGTSNALKEALKADPQRARTLGIITKLDLMDKGTNCEEVLRGNQYKLRLGFIGLVCRNFEDTKENKTIEAKILEEKKFLQDNYPVIADRNGISVLTKTISQLLLQRIYHTLPGVRVKLEKLIEICEKRLEGFGTVLGPHDRRRVLVSYLQRFRDSFKAQIDGIKRGVNRYKLLASARIQVEYQNLLTTTTSFELMEGVTNAEIDRTIKNSHALHNIVPMAIDDAFQEFARDEVGKLRGPLLECASNVNAIMVNAIKDSLSEDAKRFPKLNNFIAIVAGDVINDCFKRCKEYLEIFLDSEEAMVYSSDLDFYQKLKAEEVKTSAKSWKGVGSGSGSSQAKPPETLNQEEFSASDPVFVKGREEIRRMVKNYFEMVKHNIKEHCPKAISNLLVYNVLNKLWETLILRLDTAEHVDVLMKESDEVQRNRTAIQDHLNKFIQAREIINEVLKAAAV